jgi:RNA polymerase sigma-70 factor (ECF subfamily)
MEDNHKEIACIEAVLRGDKDAFRWIYENWYRWVWSVVARHVPKDAVEETVQDAFYQTYKSLKTWKQTGSFKSWLRPVVVRASWQYWRKSGRNRKSESQDLSYEQQQALGKIMEPAYSEGNMDAGTADYVKETLDWALGQLVPADRMVMRLIYLEDYSPAEAAKILGWTRVNVLVRAHRVRKKLKKLLKNEVENGKRTSG